MEVRELKVEDMPGWVALVQQLSPNASLGVFTDRSAFINLTKLQPKRILVIEEDGKIIGTVSMMFEIKINRGTNQSDFYEVCHIEEVIVDKDCQGRGLGKLLMQKAVEIAKANDVYKIILSCSQENVAFYEKCGFHQHEVTMRLDV